MYQSMPQARGSSRSHSAIQVNSYKRVVQRLSHALESEVRQQPVIESAIRNPQSAFERTAYTEYHPRWYRRQVSARWWTGSWAYLRFMLRELSSVFVAYFVVVTLLQIRALNHGPES